MKRSGRQPFEAGKSILLGLGLFLSSEARAILLNGEVWVTPNLVHGQVCNTAQNSTLACAIYAQGLALNVYNGLDQLPMLMTHQGLLAPEQCGSAFIYATGPWAFQALGAGAWAVCELVEGTGE